MDHQRQLEFDDPKVAGYVYGSHNANLRAIERALSVNVSARGTVVALSGDDEEALTIAVSVLGQLYELVEKGHVVTEPDVERAVDMVRNNEEAKLGDVFLDVIFTSSGNRTIAPKGLNQKRYVEAMRRHDVVFGIGPAGTGKTYLAMAMALSALTRNQVKRVILTRPAVEAGEKLGFLPGTLEDKVNPYLRPLFDAIFDMLDAERAGRLIEKRIIEVAPLAFMRGRTLNDAFVVLDEAQNTTRAQMKMFLTRLGFDSKAVITGDITQTDLPSVRDSGLYEASRVLKGVPGISFCRFEQKDVVRHQLVMRIIEAYEKDLQARLRREERARRPEEGQEPPTQGS